MRKFLVPLALKEKFAFISSFILSVLTVMVELGAPIILAYLLDKELLEGIGAKNPRRYIIVLLVYLFGALLGSVLSYLSVYGFQRCANAIARNLQQALFERVQHLPVSYFDHHPSGHLVSRLVNDSNDVRILFQTVLAQMVLAGFYLLGIYGILFTRDYRLGLVALAPLPIMALLLYVYSKKASRYNTRYRKELSAVNAHLNESIQGMSLMQSMGKEHHLLDEYENISKRLYATGIDMTRLDSLTAWNAVGFLRFLMITAILLVFGLSHYRGRALSLGSMYLLIDYSGKIFNQLNNIMQRMGQLESAKGAFNHIGELLKVPLLEEKQGEIKFMGDVHFKNISFNYKEDQPILKDVSFHLPAGETLGIVGATGSGKSTLMNLLFGFYPYKEGEILLDGTPLRTLNLQKFRSQCAMVLQDPYLFKGTVYENIQLERPEITREIAEKALLDLGGKAMLEHLESGMDQPLEEGGKNLSAGERQLLSFARALAGDPKLLLLDEATASIDSGTENLIQESIKKLSQGRTTLLIAHRLSTIQDADNILVLDHGRVIELGNHQELLKKNGAYYKLYMEQSKDRPSS